MAKWLLTVESNCADPPREQELNEWYDTVHLPDILEVPGFSSISRYVNNNAEEGQCKFLAVYEIETDNIERTLAEFDRVVNTKAKQGRMSDLLIATGGGLYRQITAPMKRKRK